MRQFLYALHAALLASLFLMPIYYRFRHRFPDRRSAAASFLFSLYLAGTYAVAGLPNLLYVRFDPRVNLEPFLYMFTALRTTALNVVLFLPMGYFPVLLWRTYRNPLKCLCLGFSLSLLIEILQMFTYRATDINDLITNTFGTLMGYLPGLLTLRIRPDLFLDRPKKDMLLIFGSVFFVMFFLHPIAVRLLLLIPT